MGTSHVEYDSKGELAKRLQEVLSKPGYKAGRIGEVFGDNPKRQQLTFKKISAYMQTKFLKRSPKMNFGKALEVQSVDKLLMEWVHVPIAVSDGDG